MATTTRSTFLAFTLPDLGGEELSQIKQAFESGRNMAGAKTRQLERLFAEYVGAKHAVAVSSATAAVHLALEAIGVKRGDEVITSPYVFPSSTEAIHYFGAHPVFVDVDPVTLNMRPELIAPAVTERTKAILPVHVAGLPADMDRICQVARYYGLKVISDATYAFPATLRGQMLGSTGDFTCFSFCATNSLSAGHGGMMCTDNAAWAEWCRIMASHGIGNTPLGEDPGQDYQIITAGYDYTIGDLASSIGLVQLGKAEKMWSRRREIAAMYNRAFEEHPELQVPREQADRQHGWHQYILRLNLDTLRIDKAEFIKQLRANNIGCSVHFVPLHIHPYYRRTYQYEPMDFPVAFTQYQRAISLPIYSKMSDEDLRDVIDFVLAVVEANKV